MLAFTYDLAERLGKTLAELGQMSMSEFVGWQAREMYLSKNAEFREHVAAQRDTLNRRHRR